MAPYVQLCRESRERFWARCCSGFFCCPCRRGENIIPKTIIKCVHEQLRAYWRRMPLASNFAKKYQHTVGYTAATTPCRFVQMCRRTFRFPAFRNFRTSVLLATKTHNFFIEQAFCVDGFRFLAQSDMRLRYLVSGNSVMLVMVELFEWFQNDPFPKFLLNVLKLQSHYISKISLFEQTVSIQMCAWAVISQVIGFY